MIIDVSTPISEDMVLANLHPEALFRIKYSSDSSVYIKGSPTTLSYSSYSCYSIHKSRTIIFKGDTFVFPLPACTKVILTQE